MVSNLSPSSSALWRHQEQYLTSLLWSAFLGLDQYSARRAFKRFRPYSAEWVLRELLGEGAGVRPASESSVREHPGRACPDEAFLKLALWSIAPIILRAGGKSAPLAARTRADDLVRELRKLDIDLAHCSLDLETRPPLPPYPELGIGQTEISVTGGRRYARVRLSSSVQIRYEELTPAIDPAHWSVCGFWHMPKVSSPDEEGAIKAVLRLPGGAWRDERVKERKLNFRFATAYGAFESRIDYDAREAPSPHSEEARSTEMESENESAPPTYGDDRPHVDRLRGFLSVEKVAGQPGWTRLVAERSAVFDSPNHDRFRVETLIFWLTSELLWFVLPFRKNVP